MPAGPGVRVDTALRPGDRVPPDYDPMIAKIMTVGRDRDAAIGRMRRALDEVQVTGIQTTLPFHRALVGTRRSGRPSLSTDWVDRHWDGSAARSTARVRATGSGGGLDSGARRRRWADDGCSVFAQRRREHGRLRGVRRADGRHRPVAAMSDATTPRPPRATGPVLVTVAAASAIRRPGLRRRRAGGGAGGVGSRAVGRSVGADDDDGRRRVEVVVDGWRFEVVVEDAARADLRDRATRERGSGSAAGGATEVRAIIPGRVASVAVTAGDIVEAGQALLVVEAMKMQNELRAPRAGTVERVPARPEHRRGRRPPGGPRMTGPGRPIRPTGAAEDPGGTAGATPSATRPSRPPPNVASAS